MIVGKEDIPVAHHQSYNGIRLNFKVIVIGHKKVHWLSLLLRKECTHFCFVVTLYCEKLFSRHGQFNSTINIH